MTHFSDERIQDLFDALGPQATSDAHIASCAECRASLDRLIALHDRLLAMPRESHRISSLRIDVRRHGWWRRAAQIAAAIAIFAFGYAAGRRHEAAPPQISSDPIVEVQRTGTEYAAAIANARAKRDGKSYEVARSTLYGAATEVARLAPERSEVRLTAAALAPRTGNNVGF